MILTSLNFLVAVDVIETLIKPASTYKLLDLYKLAIVAGVRTLLAYFLGKETLELEEGWYRFTAESTEVYACPRTTSTDPNCKGGQLEGGQVASLCKSGSDGPLCSMCGE